jgi:membrane associated rhomboid family serine protease
MFFFLPLGTDRPCWRRPYATYALMAACVGVFALQSSSPGSLPVGFVPADPSLWAWLMSMFLHGGIMHLAGNMLFLWLFGTIAEDVLGPKLFLLFYFAGHVGATGLDMAMGSLGPTWDLGLPRVGASGAIAGIMGLSAVCFLRTKVKVWYLVGMFVVWRTNVTQIRAPAFLGLWVGWEVVQGTILSAFGGGDGVAHWAHVGGFAAGLGGALGLGLTKRIARSDLVQGRVPFENSFQAFERAGEIEEVVKESPQDGEAWLALGRGYEIAGRFEKAKQAYDQALPLLLAAHQAEDIARAYLGSTQYGLAAQLTIEQEFDLARALEQTGHAEHAWGLFHHVALAQPGSSRGETAIIRAAEISRTALNDNARAATCYQRLLDDYPFSNWRALAEERLREMGTPRPPASESRRYGPEVDVGWQKIKRNL